MQLVRLVRSGRRPTADVRRRQLAALAIGVLLLLVGALTLPPSDIGTASHTRGAINQLHRLPIAVDSASAAGKDVHHTASDPASLAALVLLAGVLAVLVGVRRRGRRPIARPVPAQRGRGPPA